MGEDFSGNLTPAGKKLPYGIPSSFIVFIKREPPTNISIQEGEWVMKATEDLVRVLEDWIEAYYE